MEQHPPDGPAAYRRAADLLEQAFAVHVVGVGDPWCSSPEFRAVLPEGERDRYIAAAQVYATLAHAAAVVEQTGARGPGDISVAWSDLVWPQCTPVDQTTPAERPGGDV